MTHSETPTLIREENDTLVTDWIFVEDVMRIFHVSERTVYRWTADGVLSYSCLFFCFTCFTPQILRL